MDEVTRNRHRGLDWTRLVRCVAEWISTIGSPVVCDATTTPQNRQEPVDDGGLGRNGR